MFTVIVAPNWNFCFTRILRYLLARQLSNFCVVVEEPRHDRTGRLGFVKIFGETSRFLWLLVLQRSS